MFVNGETSFYDKARYKHGVWKFHIFVMRSFKRFSRQKRHWYFIRKSWLLIPYYIVRFVIMSPGKSVARNNVWSEAGNVPWQHWPHGMSAGPRDWPLIRRHWPDMESWRDEGEDQVRESCYGCHWGAALMTTWTWTPGSEAFIVRDGDRENLIGKRS